MKLSYLSPIRSRTEITDVFKGYNHNLRIGDGEFYDMENMTSDHYPVLSSCSPRGKYTAEETDDAITGIIAKNELCYTTGTSIVIGDTDVELGLDEATEKQLVSMGAYIIIAPDMKYINTEDYEDFGDIKVDGAKISCDATLCREDGTPWPVIISLEQPSKANRDFLWFDAQSTPPRYLRYYPDSVSWNEEKTYVKIKGEGIVEDLSAGDVVRVYTSIFETYGEDRFVKIVRADETQIILEGWIGIDEEEYEDGDKINVVKSSGNVRVRRPAPATRLLCEKNNRLWGCGTDDNTIYASKLGDFKNWQDYSASSTASYAVTVGSDGPFTGSVSYKDSVIFFKETCMHKIYGSYPAEFTLQTIPCEGVAKGAEKSLAVIDGVLYYQGRSGIWAYDGSVPVKISENMGDVMYKDGVACGYRGKYYIDCVNASEPYERELLVYDTKKQLWHKETATEATAFADYKDNLYYIRAEGFRIYELMGTSNDKPVKWFAETGIIGTNDPDSKYITKLNVRMSLAPADDGEEYAEFYVQYDSSGKWERLNKISVEATDLRSFTVPIPLRRCDHLRLRIEGEGDVKIYSIAKTIYGGSDVV